jgi:spore coat protein X
MIQRPQIWVKSKHDKKFRQKQCDESSSSSSSSSSSKHRDGPQVTMSDAGMVQENAQFNMDVQESDELIIIKESCGIKVNTTENEVALSLQLALQLALTIVVKIAIGTSDNAESITQELVQHFNSDQKIVKKIHIENSKDTTITVDVNEIAVNIQAMLQILLALVAKLEVL